MKKGQGLPLQTIIIAIICLLVLVVLIAIFTGKIRGWSEGSGSCDAVGGAIVLNAACNVDNGDFPLGRSFSELAKKKDETDSAHETRKAARVCCKNKNTAG